MRAIGQVHGGTSGENESFGSSLYSKEIRSWVLKGGMT